MDVLSLNELKSLCEKRKLPTSGSKEALVERLLKSASASRNSSSSSSSVAAGSAGSVPPVAAAASGEYESMTIPQLKDLCRERMLPVGGIKDDLVARLNASDPRKMSLVQLKELCRDAGLPVTGTKADLTERVMKNMTSGASALLQSKSVDELKELCRVHGAPVTGKKEELIERIKQANTAKPKKTTESSSSAKDQGSSSGSAALTKKPSMPDYASMTIPQLKEICREGKLMVGGTKEEIVERLLQAPASAPSSRPSSASGKRPSVVPTSILTPAASTDASYESMTIPQLKDRCRERTLPVMGNKDELVSRLNHHDDVIRTMFKKPKSTTAIAVETSTIGVKRSASSDEPKRKKAKTTPATEGEPGSKKAPKNLARKSTGGKAPRVEPPQTAARKGPPYEWRPFPSGRYVVFSTFGFPSQTHGASSPPTFYDSYNVAEGANLGVDDIFYHKNPWGLERLEMDDEDVQEDYDGDLLQLKIRSGDGREWVVGVKDRGTAAIDDKVKPKKAKTTAATAKEPKAKKAPAARTKKSTGATTQAGRYQVYSTCAYPRDNFHTYEGPGHPTYYDSYDSIEVANKRISSVFYGKNPWGLGRDEMDDLDVDETWRGGLLQLSLCPPDSEEWCVGGKDRAAAADEDSDVVMVSGSDTEDEDSRYGY